MQSKTAGVHQHAGVQAYGNVEHENTAIVCEISIKVGAARTLFVSEADSSRFDYASEIQVSG
jgi:hypothetical protein